VDCASGTDRVAEAARGMDEEIIINLQGDEPLMDPSVIDSVALPFLSDPDVLMSTAALPGDDPAEFARLSVVKVVVDCKGDALYFSRAPVPHYRDNGVGPYRKHLGIYGYRREFLFRVAGLAPSALEEAERLEQLRVLQAGYRIRVVDVTHDSVGVDTPEDLKAVEERICGPKNQ
jgi:3-deoxy-manno-octulosonate cytidylyltransferase (CMP-KDO synthetase)